MNLFLHGASDFQVARGHAPQSGVFPRYQEVEQFIKENFKDGSSLPVPKKGGDA